MFSLMVKLGHGWTHRRSLDEPFSGRGLSEGVRGAIPLAQEQIDILLRLITACGEPIRTFLDLGCGDGVLAAAIFQRYPQAQGVLVDFSAPMLEAARNRFADQNVSVRFANLDYGLESWARSVDEFGPFDTIVSGYSIHH